MKLHKIFALALVLTLALALTACGGSAEYKDGKYEAESDDRDEHGGYGVVSIEVKDGKIAACEYNTYNKDGSLKDENYQIKLKDENPALFKLAQDSVAANPGYAEQLVKYQKVEDVDVISGATWNHLLFKDAAEKALKDAVK